MVHKTGLVLSVALLPWMHQLQFIQLCSFFTGLLNFDTGRVKEGVFLFCSRVSSKVNLISHIQCEKQERPETCLQDCVIAVF